MTRSLSRRLWGSAVALLFTLGACGEGEVDPTDEGPRIITEGADVVACADVDPVETVRMQNNSFLPHVVLVEVNEVVRFVNEDTMPHTVTSGSPGLPEAGEAFDSGQLAPGDEFCLRFVQPETYVFHCTLHPEEMREALVVVSEP